jgi:hypothetical protein
LDNLHKLFYRKIVCAITIIWILFYPRQLQQVLLDLFFVLGVAAEIAVSTAKFGAIVIAINVV